jgi:pimeloyl-ACP methyl ester carboxylesterase
MGERTGAERSCGSTIPGHGSSSGDFLDGSIGDWLDGCPFAAILTLTVGPQVLVGSSMGGWISLLMARAHPEKVAGLVTIAAAPDFTEDSMWAGFSDAQRQALLADGQVALPSDYSDEPYVITRRLIEDGRDHLVLRISAGFAVSGAVFAGNCGRGCASHLSPCGFLDHVTGQDIRLTIGKGGGSPFLNA